MTGGCLCGAVRYEARGEPIYAGHCYCRDCQRATGAGHASFMGFERSNVTMTGETRRFSMPGGSGRPTFRHFCPTCGSTIYGDGEEPGRALTIYAGTLDDTSLFRPDHAIHVRSRAHWDVLAAPLREYERMP